jgi:hypothetical protein
VPQAISLGGVVLSSRRITFPLLIAAIAVIALAPLAVEGQSTVAVSPFVSLVPSSNANPLAGMALTFGGTTGLALRGSADMSIANPNKLDSASGGSRYRPWGADADAMLFLGGLGGGATVFSRALSPYLFSGIGLTGGDSAGRYVVNNGWSYGAGAAIPLGLDADLFAEARWRMSQYVLPTAKGAPDSKSEFRFGLSFHVGGGSRSEPAPRRRGRHMDVYDNEEEVVAYPAPTYPASPAPTATATATAINVSMPPMPMRTSRPRRYEPSVLPSASRSGTYSVRAPADVRNARVVHGARRRGAVSRAATKSTVRAATKSSARARMSAAKQARRRSQD